MAVLRRPDVYRAAVAGAPVSEWRDYDTHYTERYLGLPEAADAEGPYSRSSVLTYAAQEGEHRPLLVVHGTADDNVYFSHAVKLSDALFRAGRPHEFLPLAGLTHMVPEPIVTRRLQTRIIDFFRDNLRER
jgi:dipeptidyl-peptidase-4